MDPTVDVLVLGSGVAGLAAAVHAAACGASTTVLTKGELDHSATRYAQGGVAAALTAPDSPQLHLADTLAAGAGLCDVDAVKILVAEGPQRVLDLIALGAVFDRTDDGEQAALALAREGGHSMARVVHAGGDATGEEIERALVAAVRATAAEVRESCMVLDLLVESGRCAGVRALDPLGEAIEVRARHTILATGGAGQCYAVTTNPPLSTGDGIAMALRAGAAVADLEFMQFHPTALDHDASPRQLLSEALRGEGAVLRDDDGFAFMAALHPLADLAPRDIVARAIEMRLRAKRGSRCWLDATSIKNFPSRFPTIWNACQSVGLDPRSEYLPVAPAAHYLSGGVCADLDGAASLPGLWAVGEVACSGVHGANRLASNSLLDGLVFGRRAAAAIVAGRAGPEATGVLAGVLPGLTASVMPDEIDRIATAATSVAKMFTAPKNPSEVRDSLQGAMTHGVGVLRDAQGLASSGRELGALGSSEFSVAVGRLTREQVEVANLLEVATATHTSASARLESRGTHSRLDYPNLDADFLGRLIHSGASSLNGGPNLVPLVSQAELVS